MSAPFSAAGGLARLAERGDPGRHLADPEEPRAGRPVVDSHVHVFPPRVFQAIWRWFDEHAWPIRYREEADGVLRFLAAQGVEAAWGLHYAHVPGMARALNAFVTDLASRWPMLVPFGTVLPGEPDALDVVAESLDGHGHAGLKLHCHVQKLAADDPRLMPVLEAVAARGKVVVLHAGREPSSEAYGFDCRRLCGVEPIARVLERVPGLKLVVPHLGQDQWREFFALARSVPNLYLDTAMAVGGYLTDDRPTAADLLPLSGQVLFGTDFPNLPYPWGRELRWLLEVGLPEDALEKILRGNARKLGGR